MNDPHIPVSVVTQLVDALLQARWPERRSDFDEILARHSALQDALMRLSEKLKSAETPKHHLNQANDFLQACAQGDFNASHAPPMENLLHRSAEEIVTYGNQLQGNLTKLAEGNFNLDVMKRSFRDGPIDALQKLANYLKDVQKTCQNLADGNIQQPIYPVNAQDSINNELRLCQQGLGNILGNLQALAAGDYTFEVTAKSHRDQLAQNINTTRHQLETLTQNCKALAAGEYDVQIIPQGPRDHLAISLGTLTSHLNASAQQLKTLSTGDFTFNGTFSASNNSLSQSITALALYLQSVANTCQALSVGDLSQGLKPKTENDVLARTLNQLIDNNYAILAQAQSLAKGDYSKEILARSERDQLGNTLNRLTKGLRNVVCVAQAVAEGDLSTEVDAKSENDFLAKAMNQMIGNLRAVVQQAKLIAQGDYSAQIQPQSDKDDLGKALRSMTENLQTVAAENNRRQWLKTGQAELAEQLRGERDLTLLAQNTINYLVKYTKSNIGLMYLTDQNDDCATLTATYAFTRRKNFRPTVQRGEGLVGQVMQERKTIILSDVPEDYMAVESGTGASVPRNILIAPIQLEGELLGILEIGSLREIDENTFSFVESARESIAIALRSTKDRTRMKALLEESQAQNEEMLAQSVELQAANKALEEKTSELQTSERILKEQQEELKAANQELEEKTVYLQQQKLAVQEQNSKIEAASYALEERAKELELASKYKSEFLANMSHELRTPLNSLLILSKSLSKNADGNLTVRQVENATMIYNSGNDLLSLINEILDLSKVEAGKMVTEITETKLSDMLEILQRQFRPIATEQALSFIINVDPKLPAIFHTDRQRVAQILKNLISNAMKFTHEGSVTLHVYLPDNETEFTCADLSPQNTIAFSVIDTGIGIPAKKQRDIFEAFQQADGSTSREYGGTGLGLTISRELAHLMGGEIQLHSVEGQGATFTLFLPLSQSAAEDQPVFDEPATSPKVAPPQGPKADFPQPTTVQASLPKKPVSTTAPLDPTAIQNSNKPLPPLPTKNQAMFSTGTHKKKGEDVVIVIEDDVPFGRMVTEKITERGLKGLLAPSGTVGLQLIEHFHPCAVLLDLKLPDMDGMEILEAIKRNPKTKHIPVQVLSSKDIVADSINRGAFGYLKKPVDLDELDLTLRKLETFSTVQLTNVLLVEDDANTQNAVRQLFSDSKVPIECVPSGEAALEKMKSEEYDCVILDLSLNGMDGFKLLDDISALKGSTMPPVIVYTARDLTQDEYFELNKYTQSIIIKGRESEERLVDEVGMFLHRLTQKPTAKTTGTPPVTDSKDRLKGKRILLVDDDIRNVYALSQELRDYGLEVEMADNGQLALDKLAQTGPVDLVLMDIMMPVMDGNEAIKRIRAQAKFEDMPIIALTAKAMPDDRKKTLEVGANDFLTKPVDLDALVSLMSMRLVNT